MDINTIFDAVITLVVAVLASGGFWAYFQSRHTASKAETRLLRGIAHDRIVWLGMNYIQRGYIYGDELDNLYTYLYLPYKKLDGNGTAEEVMERVMDLPIKTRTFTDIENKE